MATKPAWVATNTTFAIVGILPLVIGCVVRDGPTSYRSESRPPAVQIVVVDHYDYYPSCGIYYLKSVSEELSQATPATWDPRKDTLVQAHDAYKKVKAATTS